MKVQRYSFMFVCFIVFTMLLPGTTVSAAPIIRLEKDVPQSQVSPVPTNVTFDLYDSPTSTTMVATQTFARGEWWADYGFNRFSTASSPIVRFKADFTNTSGLTGAVDLWMEIRLDGVVKGQREQVKKECWALYSEEALDAVHAENTDFAADADMLDGMDSSEFVTGAHTHDGSDIATGTVADARIASTIARDTEIMPTVLAGDGSGSGLDADRLDGLTSTDFSAAAHSHSGADITSGTVADARIASTIARDTEIMPTVLAADGPGSGLNADTVDGAHASGFVTQAEYDALLARVEALEAKLQYMTVQSGVINGLAGPHVIFTGANVHIRSGSGTTDDGGSLTGRGNLIIGYNEYLAVPVVGRGGSHNLIIGRTHEYSSYGGLVAGRGNTISGAYATVTGGYGNTASNTYASVSGGQGGTASAYAASVSGGKDNVAGGQYASVSGGVANAAGGNYSSVSGGYDNDATYLYSSVSGGTANTASGQYANVSGGESNEASNYAASVSGGVGNTATGQYASISGGSVNIASGDNSSVSGGAENEAAGESASVTGGDINAANSSYSSVTGGRYNTANGFVSSVTGGYDNDTIGYYSSISGGTLNETSAYFASVSGGESNDASGEAASVSGGLGVTASGLHDWRGGSCAFCDN